MPAAQGELPAVSRRRVRLALRQAREDIGLSQGAVAKSLSWSLSKLQRIELGEVNVSPTDLRALLDAYGVTDPAVIEPLMAHTRTARRERYWNAEENRDRLSPALRQLAQFEVAAARIRVFQLALVPGLLQTYEYAGAALDWFDVSLTTEERARRHEVRMTRRRQVLGGETGPVFHAMIDESVLYRTVGGLDVTAGQFEDLVKTGALPRVHIRVLPFDVGARLSSFGYFTLAELDEKEAEDGTVEDAVLYREIYVRDELVEDPQEVAGHQRVFARYWRQALDEEASRALILAHALELRARQARGGA